MILIAQVPNHCIVKNSGGNSVTSNKATLSVSIVEDVDAHVYHQVKIGNQVWMLENLKTTKYRNGDPIPNIETNSEWGDCTSAACCWYGNSSSYEDVYGVLYNHNAACDQRVPPIGWHVPSDEEWMIMEENYKSELWTVLGGYRSSWGQFDNIDNSGSWWSATESPDDYASYWNRMNGSEGIGRLYQYKTNGFSIRCIRD